MPCVTVSVITEECDPVNNFSFVKAKPITNEKALLMEEIKEAVENVKLARQGKIKAKPLNELLNKL